MFTTLNSPVLPSASLITLFSVSFWSLPYLSLAKARALDYYIEIPGRLEESADKWAGTEENNTVRQQPKSNLHTCSIGAPIRAAEL